MGCWRLFLCALFFASYFCEVYSLKKGDFGACPRDKELRKINKRSPCPTHFKECTPQEKKEFGKFDQKKFRCCSLMKTLVTCCPGYAYNTTSGSCYPICTPTCEHGKCVQPNLCECDPLYSWHDRKCIPSVCDPPCGDNTICTNDTCTCVRDTLPFNKTHCAPKCDKGYELNHLNLVCEPVCESGCQNGVCERPNVCTCKDGYEPDNNSCVPVCSDCGNGDCVAPNDCRCHEPDYTKHQNGSCVPVCSEGCINSDCTAPNFCTCRSGYEKTDPSNQFACHPICTPECVNADCTAPNICTCRSGYEKTDPSNPFVCQPTCSPECVNADCTAPNICTCRSGYEKTDPSNPFVCQPTCSPECVNADCTAPNICTCRIGYEKTDPSNSFACQPTCSPECINADCTAPNFCTCRIGYEKTDPSNSFACQPTCSPECINADCTAPNFCSCHTGYDKTDPSNQFACHPICTPECINADCTAPNFCSCHTGYDKTDPSNQFECHPICTPECANADCTAPNFCSCHTGYDKTDPSNQFACHPICTPECINADCTAPNFCSCHTGYDKTDPSNQFACHPICTPECVNADCTAPNNCNCFDGHETMIGQEWTCIRKCDAGYVRNSSDPSACFKPCKGLCDYGVCTKDGVCVCRNGYELVNDTCYSLPPVECSVCEHNCSDAECWCLDGRPCTSRPEVGAEVTSTGLAAMELTWALGGAMLVLLLALLLVVMHQLYRRRRIHAKAAASDPYGASVVYTVPDTLRTQRTVFGEANEATEPIEVTGANEVEANECEATRSNAEPLLSGEKH